MKRHPVCFPAAPAYPDRHRARSWALGLLALGTTAIATAPLVGCGNMKPPAAHGAHDCPGDMQEPAADPATAPAEGAEAAEPCTIPEAGEDPHATPEGHQDRVRGDLVAPEPVEPGAEPDVVPEEHPEHISGDMPHVDGDIVAPEVEAKANAEDEGQAEPCEITHEPIPGGMKHPVEPTPEPEPAEEEADDS